MPSIVLCIIASRFNPILVFPPPPRRKHHQNRGYKRPDQNRVNEMMFLVLTINYINIVNVFQFSFLLLVLPQSP